MSSRGFQLRVKKLTKAITLTNHKRRRQLIEPIRITCNRRQARENARMQSAIGFGFASHWLRKLRAFGQPIIE